MFLSSDQQRAQYKYNPEQEVQFETEIISEETASQSPVLLQGEHDGQVKRPLSVDSSNGGSTDALKKLR